NRDAFFRRSWRSQRRSDAITGKSCDPSNDCRERKQHCRRPGPAQTGPAFLHRLESLRQLRIAEFIVIEVHYRYAHPMFRFARTKIVQERSPLLVFFQTFSRVMGENNLPGIAAIHHPLRHVKASAREIGPVVDIDHPTNWAAVDSHPTPYTRMFLERAADLRGL